MRPVLAAAAPTCAPSNSPITLNFVTNAPPPIYNNRLTVAGIRNLFATRGESLAGLHRRALGVTYVQTMLSLRASTRLKPTGGGYCVYLDKVDAEFGWDRMEVFVASEYKPGACEYRTILDHENQHVAINQGALRENAPLVRAALEQILRDQPPIFRADPQGGADAAITAIHQRMNAVLDSFQRTMSQRNANIDSDNNYDATAQMCNGWDGSEKPPTKP